MSLFLGIDTSMYHAVALLSFFISFNVIQDSLGFIILDFPSVDLGSVEVPEFSMILDSNRWTPYPKAKHFVEI